MSEKKFYLKLTLISAAVGIAVYFFLLTFNVRKTDISGTRYSSEAEILRWLKKENGDVNSLYTLFKLNYMKPEPPPAASAIRASMIRPWHISLHVTEKAIVGYVDYRGNYLCFDEEGRATFVVTKGAKVEGAAYVLGLEIDRSKIKSGERLPVADERVLGRVVQASTLLKKYKLFPETIICEAVGLKLHFQSVDVLLGKSEYEKRIAQLPPILKKLSENYPEMKGTLHLENFDSSGESVRFVPETGDVP